MGGERLHFGYQMDGRHERRVVYGRTQTEALEKKGD